MRRLVAVTALVAAMLVGQILGAASAHDGPLPGENREAPWHASTLCPGEPPADAPQPDASPDSSAHTWMLGKVPYFHQGDTAAHPDMSGSSCAMFTMLNVLQYWGIDWVDVDDIWDYLEDADEHPSIGVWHPNEAAKVYRHYGLDYEKGTDGEDWMIKMWVRWNCPVNIWVITRKVLGLASDHVVTITGYDDNYHWGSGMAPGAFYVHDPSGAFVSKACPIYETLPQYSLYDPVRGEYFTIHQLWDVPVPYDKVMDAWDSLVWDPDQFWDPFSTTMGYKGYIVAYKGQPWYPELATATMEVAKPAYAPPGAVVPLDLSMAFSRTADCVLDDTWYPVKPGGAQLRVDGARFISIRLFGPDGTFDEWDVAEQADGSQVVNFDGLSITNSAVFCDPSSRDYRLRADRMVTVSATVWIEVNDPPPEDGWVGIDYRGWLEMGDQWHRLCPLHTVRLSDDRRPSSTVMPALEHYIVRCPDDVPHDGLDQSDYACEHAAFPAFEGGVAGTGDYLYATSISCTAPAWTALEEQVSVVGTVVAHTSTGDPAPVGAPLGQPVTLTYSTEPPLAAGAAFIPADDQQPKAVTFTTQAVTDASGSYSDRFAPDRAGAWYVEAAFEGDPPYMGSTGSCSFRVGTLEGPVGAGLELPSPALHVGDTAPIVVRDPDCDLDRHAVDRVMITVDSASYSTGIHVELLETGSNTGVFEGAVPLSSTGSGDNSLHVMGGDSITVKYLDLAPGDVLVERVATAAVAPVALAPVSVTEPTVSIRDISQTVAPGESFDVDVWVEPVGGGVSAASIVLAFDPAAMHVDHVGMGSFLGDGPIVAPGYPKIDNDVGTVEIDAARKGATSPPTESNTFARITLTATDDWNLRGVYSLVPAKAELADENALDIPRVVARGGTVVIAEPKEILPLKPGALDEIAEAESEGEASEEDDYARWDLNKDCTVDEEDLAILGSFYGRATQPPYPRADVNEDSQVDVKDLSLIAAHWGETRGPCSDDINEKTASPWTEWWEQFQRSTK